MANKLNVDINKRYVVVKDIFQRTTDRLETRVYFADGGFGCEPFTNGTCVGGWFAMDEFLGEKKDIYTRVEGFDIIRFANEEEVNKSREYGASLAKKDN